MPETRENYHRRIKERKELITKKLGEECKDCKATGYLEIDHIDPSTKNPKLVNKSIWFLDQLEFQLEIEKCQLLCQDCHEKKSVVDRGHKPIGDRHGTLRYKYGCRCPICKKAIRDYYRDYRLRKKSNE